MDKLKLLRKRNNLSQQEMAVILGISLSLYEKVERGAASASAAFMRRIRSCFPEADLLDIFFAQASK